ncbi:hypothetical protein GCM10023323_75170 [Streptomyces thinghirensis]|uniref:Uncharacterized protein n=1 Tax=Streptomyces thinghirensis TaxID=551547 RepID=A0ABP9THL2_9ACTN
MGVLRSLRCPRVCVGVVCGRARNLRAGTGLVPTVVMPDRAGTGVRGRPVPRAEQGRGAWEFVVPVVA